jgi:hypothetical protein
MEAGRTSAFISVLRAHRDRPGREAAPASTLSMKNHHHNGPVHPDANSRSVIHESIATRAYALWERDGKPENQSEALWLEAERSLMTEREIS